MAALLTLATVRAADYARNSTARLLTAPTAAAEKARDSHRRIEGSKPGTREIFPKGRLSKQRAGLWRERRLADCELFFLPDETCLRPASTAVVIAGLLLLRARDDAPDALVRADVAGVKLAYPRAYARDDATAAGGLADRLAFIASFPAFVPLPATSQGAAPSIVMTVTPKDDSLDPQERPAKLYARFLTPKSLVGPGGLVSGARTRLPLRHGRTIHCAARGTQLFRGAA